MFLQKSKIAMIYAALNANPLKSVNKFNCLEFTVTSIFSLDEEINIRLVKGNYHCCQTKEDGTVHGKLTSKAKVLIF